MNAAELRAIASALNYQSWSEWRTEDESKFAQAAEILELIAWADGEQVEIHKTMNGVHSVIGWGPLEFHGNTLIDTLRRAREAAR